MPGGSYKTAKPLPVRSTAVIGAGTMGSGIAVCLLSAGLPVYLLEQNEKVRCIPTLYTCVSTGVEPEGKMYTYTMHVCIYWSRTER